MRHLVCAARLLVSVALMIAGSLAMLVIGLLTAFRLRRFYRETLNAMLCEVILRIWAIRVEVHGRPAAPVSPVIYMSNHSSTLDMFVLAILRLPNTRFYMSGWLRRLFPIGIIGYMTGVIWTARQWHTERRVEIFKRGEALLRRTGESAYLSPEGTRVATGDIGRFNKGAFHTVTNLGWPIHPFFILIPQSIDPGMGVCADRGTINVHFLPAIDTSTWRVEDLVENKEMVRERFVGWHRQLHAA